tara:strand:- start:129624 stop:130157 length:534 start_codon:yes stop_codon:yes gene_type:complete
MKNQFSIIVLLSLFLGFGACKKTNLTPPPEVIDNYMIFTADQVKVEARFKVILQDEIFNGYFKDTKTIQMQRYMENGNPQRLIFKIERIDLANTTFPVTIKYSIDQGEPTVGVTYVDVNNLTFGTNINNPDDFTLTLTGYENNLLQGTYAGNLFSGITTHPKVEITNGELNIELVTY